MKLDTLIRAGSALAAIAAGTVMVTFSATPVAAQTTLDRTTTEIAMSEGRAQIVNLPAPISDVVVSNPQAVDVQVKSPRQIVLFAKGEGESSIFATAKDGRVVYSSNVRVGQNANSLDAMLHAAMPDAQIKTTSMNGMILLTGTVRNPEDASEAERLVKGYVGDKSDIVSRLRTATPLQVQLHVKFAEVSRDVAKKIGVNLTNRDLTSGFLFGVGQGRSPGSISTVPYNPGGFPLVDASKLYNLPDGSIQLPFNTTTGQVVLAPPTTAYSMNTLTGGPGTVLGLAGRALGMDILSTLDLAESDGFVTTLAQPNLTALSGETASFLAGGEIPIPVSQGQGQVSVEFKPYGISLAFTPTVLSDGSISMRVRPEVSQVNYSNAVNLNGFAVPSLSTRRTETSVTLGSGQSIVLAGLLSKNDVNNLDKAPGIGDVPVIGALFRSPSFRKSETELVIVVTPYLVKPVSANEITLPTDGYRSANDFERFIQGQTFSPKSGGDRPKPSMAPPVTVPATPSVTPQAGPVAPPASKGSSKSAAANPAATPGFGN